MPLASAVEHGAPMLAAASSSWPEADAAQWPSAVDWTVSYSTRVRRREVPLFPYRQINRRGTITGTQARSQRLTWRERTRIAGLAPRRLPLCRKRHRRSRPVRRRDPCLLAAGGRAHTRSARETATDQNPRLWRSHRAPPSMPSVIAGPRPRLRAAARPGRPIMPRCTRRQSAREQSPSSASPLGDPERLTLGRDLR